MFQGSRSRKAIAFSFFIVFSFSTFYPSYLYAITSGPSTPEAASFEPVDTTDLVNLQSGDFTYNIPLLEVPGPEGGYPLGLSYHAGIMPNQDASWVGLGWNLNPGAINRSVNGYPDDWLGKKDSRRDFWEGGVSQSYRIGVSVPGSGMIANASVGVELSSDTYKGFGAGVYADLGTGVGPFSASVGVNYDVISNKANLTSGVGVKMAEGLLSTSTSVGVETNFNSISSTSASSVSFSVLGISMSSNSMKPAFSVRGLTAVVDNTTKGAISTKTFGLSIPIGYFSIGYKRTKYWSDEKTDVFVTGSYNTHLNINNGTKYAFDTYSIVDESDEIEVGLKTPADYMVGGSYFDHDLYNVSGQGIGGNIRPYIIRGTAKAQDRILPKDINNGGATWNTYIRYIAAQPMATPAFFRFVNDFSNAATQNYTPYSNLNDLITYPFDLYPQYGNANESFDDSFAYNTDETGRDVLFGSRHVSTVLKVQPNNVKGYVDRYPTDNAIIKGFSITNESGVTYHYGLPAYSYDEEMYQENMKQGLNFTRLKRPLSYAYTWHLTTVTGPDFVDRNANGKADAADWGYWVNFDYGKWSNNYVWRNPAEGFHRDDDPDFKNCTMGRKEIYYLNSISTRTHTALFEKTLRIDGKGSSQSVFAKNGGSTETTYLNSGVFDVNSSQTLLLSKIYLLNTSDAAAISTAIGPANAFSPPSGQRSYTSTDFEMEENIFDNTDVDAYGRWLLESKSIRIVQLNQDYSLAKGTINSFNISTPSQKFGKLTLNSIQFKGRRGVSLIPPLRFEYELGSDSRTGTGSLTSTSFSSTATFEIGDLLITNEATPIYCGVITKSTLVDPGNGTRLYTLANSLFSGSGIKSVRTTKNPPYHKDYFDIWGLYKADLNSTDLTSLPNIARSTSFASAPATDVWSLRKIVSPLGGEINIQYEADSYSETILNPDTYCIMKNSTFATDRKTITFTLPIQGVPIPDLLTVGNSYDIHLFLKYYGDAKVVRSALGPITISSISGTTVTGILNTAIPSPVSGYNLQQILSGNIKLNIGKGLGGGLRVKKVISKTDGREAITEYGYGKPFSVVSSGVTSYNPTIADAIDIDAIEDGPEVSEAAFQQELATYRFSINKGNNKILSLMREVPPPGVCYEFVNIKRSVKSPIEVSARNIEGSTQYQFEVLRSNMIGITYTNTIGNPIQYGSQAARNVLLRKLTASIGNVKKVETFDALNKLTSRVQTHYLHDGLESLTHEQFMDTYKLRLRQFSNQGFIQERAVQAKGISNSPTGSFPVIKATMSAREDYPVVHVGTTSIDYTKGLHSSTKIIGYDFYSGVVNKTISTDIYGNNFLTEKEAAYRRYPALGMKLNGTVNKNMLTQQAYSALWKVDNTYNKIALVSANAEVWGNSSTVVNSDGVDIIQNNTSNGNIWRPIASYSWMANTNTTGGSTLASNFNSFNWSTPTSSHANWKKSKAYSKYNVNSKPLEVVDINNNYAAARYGYFGSKIILNASVSKVNEIAFSGAEDEEINKTGEGFVLKVDGVLNTLAAHTGSKSLQIAPNNKKGFVYTISTNKLTTGRDYIANVWVKPINVGSSNTRLYYEVNGVIKNTSMPSENSTKIADGWINLRLVIKGTDITPGNTLTVGCINYHASNSTYIDDFRFAPLNSSSSAYVYDDFTGEVQFVLDNENLYTKYEYDAAGRLIKIFREKVGKGKMIVNEYLYNYNENNY